MNKGVRNLGFAALALLALRSSSAQQIQVNKDNRTVAVTAFGSASSPADMATLHIGFLVYGREYQSAYEAGSKVSNAIAAALAAAGIQKDAIESDDQSVAPVQEFELNNLSPEQKQQRQFKVQQSWSVKGAPSETARVLDAAVKAGANQSGQIDWGIANKDALHARAMDDALSHARSAAQQLTAGLHAQLGPLVYASTDVPERGPVPVLRASNGPLEAMAKTAPLAVNPRKITDTAAVYAVFALQ